MIADIIARKGLNTLLEEIYSRKPISDPHVMIMGIGDVEMHDKAPLQVTQFEADIRLAEQLENIFLEHVTRSKTGLPYVVETLERLDIKEIEATYVSRCYMTRHGAGSFEYETKEPPYRNITEVTNKINEYQGRFRYGILDIIELAGAIDHDACSVYPKGIDVKRSFALTCLDHLDEGNVKFVFNGEQKGPINEVINAFVDLACINDAYVSFGLTGNDIKKIDKNFLK